MLKLSRIGRLLENVPQLWNCSQIAGLKYFPAPIKFDAFEKVDRPKLKIVEKVPQFTAGLRPPKMQKRLRLMRGPELVHNKLIHRQYGIIALGGGRLKWNHFEMMRMGVGRKIDVNRMFAIWRVDPPWQPVTKKGQGQRMGGGKGAIDHYVSPIKEGRVIMELGGHLEYPEAYKILQLVAHKLPFKALVVSQEIMEKRQAEEEERKRSNTNHYTMKYVIQNNFGGCHNWLSPFDHKWFGRYR
ncbi:39S ribosomal protein L16, mitochondrial [Lutzomyia longipalpis]|uniref:39S ribosomal protein L16, mitochondrial n=1 Tax=Lutzomyia longipalpis TaxID=7200 RepID=UPI002484178D|nr:39S ribosomal protein L16, mitochondrial [Lutzomyia longipalpis]